MKTVINEFKQQLILELCHFIGEPNNEETQHQMEQTIQDIINRFTAKMSGLNDIRLTFSIDERNTVEENN